MNTTLKSRWQATLPKVGTINDRIENLLLKFRGFEFPDIVKMALIKLDNDTPYPAYSKSETEWLLSNPAYGSHLLESVKQINQATPPLKTFSNPSEFMDND